MSGSRRLTSWIEGFEEYTAVKPSPILFRRWTAIATLASVLSRKVWVHTFGADLYPNVYVFLVGAPASGKTVPIDVVREDIYRELKEGYYVAPKSLTSAALSDTLAEAKVRVLRPGSMPPFVEFNSLSIFSPELGTFISSYDNDFIQRLTDLYDNGAYEERRRGKDLNLVLPKAQLNMIAGTTPSYLSSLLPPGAWDQGFISRVIMVFADFTERKNLFHVPPTNASLRAALVEDLKTVGALYGRVDWEPEAAAAMQSWHNLGGPPAPDHIRLIHYLGRRTAHLLKLCTIASVSRSNDLTIRLEDFNLALSWLLEAEAWMPEIFKAMKGSTMDGTAIDEAWYFCWAIWTKEKTPVLESRLIGFLQQRVPSYSVMKIMELLRSSSMIKVHSVDVRGTHYEPVAKGQHQG